MVPLLGLGIGFLTDLVGKYGEDLVVAGVEKVTGVDLKKDELTSEDKKAIMAGELALKELDFKKLELELEGVKESNRHAEVAKKVVIEDKQDARDMYIETTKVTGKRDKAVVVLASVIVIGFFAGLISLIFVHLDKGSGAYELLYMAFGALTMKFGTVVDFFFGSSDK
jgi:hypothetical protein